MQSAAQDLKKIYLSYAIPDIKCMGRTFTLQAKAGVESQKMLQISTVVKEN